MSPTLTRKSPAATYEMLRGQVDFISELATLDYETDDFDGEVRFDHRPIDLEHFSIGVCE